MKIFVVNAGSSSLKYQLIDMETESVLAKGICERIGTTGAITHKAADGRVYSADTAMPSHTEAFEAVVFAMTKSDAKVIDSFDEISAIGHRIVQGGSIFSKSCVINPTVLDQIDELGALAPLHNPAHVLAIKACIKTFGDKIPQVAVFDTSFHQTMEPKVYMFALPYEYYEKYGVRKYGAHGTSHHFVSDRVAVLENKDKKDLKIIVCHIGNGASITAVKDGVCCDTSMGFTPLDGFMMGTRTGTLDPSALTFIAEKENLTAAQINDICNKKSGMLGVSGVSNDNRDVCAAADSGNERAKLAVDMQRYQILKFVGSYVAAMNGVDAIAFTAGIGENDPDLRAYVCENLSYLGVKIDDAKNHIRGEEIKISTDDSKVNVYVIPTNEELAIARDTLALIS
ncbi:MAG: acetate kinase [Acutalibacteraceae bacterium]|nr:acetate kinase [Acutalibacteraceae bacterium]